MENISSQEETSLGALDHDVVHSSLEVLTQKKKRKNSAFSDEERYQIGQYASVHNPTAPVKEFKKTQLHLKFRESIARSFRTK